MNIPTTRETADHAELAVENEDCETCDGAGEVEARIGFGTDYIPCPDCVSRDHKAEKATLLSEIAALRGERDRLRNAVSKSNDEICQSLGKALGYPWFKDDQANFPGSTETDGVFVGDHVAESIADEASRRLTQAERQRDELLSFVRKLDCECDPSFSTASCGRCVQIANQGADQ